MKKLVYLLSIILLALLCLIGGWYYGLKTNLSKIHKEENVSVTLDRIEKVFKLVATEGNVSEIYDYKDYMYYDIGLFRKKVLVRVNAKILVGYDFEKVKLITDEESRTITIDSLPPPEILAIDHNLDYYDIQEGTFNNFDEAELSEINKRAKEYAASVAEDSDLFKQAEEQREELLEMLSLASQTMGWEIIIKENQKLKD